MEALVLPVTDEVAELSRPPRNFVEEELDLLAFELWRDASSPETAFDQVWSSAAKEAWCHASCL